MANIGLIGWGVVGQATGKGFATDPKNKVLWYDKFRKGPYSLAKVVRESEFIFICVPTPMFSSGSGIDLSVVEEVVANIAPKIAGTAKVLVLKSTITPGTTAKFAKKFKNTKFAMSPEFLTEMNGEWDFLNPNRVIVGAFDEGVALSIGKVYRSLHGPDAKIFLTDPTTAELAKYMSNTYVASKVIFANEMKEMADALGVNYDDIKKMVGADKRIGEYFLGVTPFRGFGGKCFPKDTVAILALARELGVDMSLIKAAWKKNLKIRKIRDWEEIEGAVSRKKGKR